jgi:hypothetical protein
VKSLDEDVNKNEFQNVDDTLVISGLRFSIADRVNNSVPLRLTANGALNDGSCYGEQFAFFDFDSVSVYRRSAGYISGLSFRKRNYEF